MKHKLRRQFTEEYREQQNSMKRIGLISDTHGTFDQTLKTFLKDVDEIWHAGDIGSPEAPTRSRRSNPCGPSMAISTEVSCDAPTVNFSPSSAKG